MVDKGEKSAEEYIGSIFDRIDRLDSKVHAYLQLDREGALATAKELDRRVKKREKMGMLTMVLAGRRTSGKRPSIPGTNCDSGPDSFQPSQDGESL